MYPLVIVLVFLGTLFLRRKLHGRGTQEWAHDLKCLGLPWGVLLQPYTCFLTVFVVLYGYLLWSFIVLFSQYAWLDRNTFRRPPVNSTVADGIRKDYEIPGWVRFLSILSPLCIGVTFVVTVVHLWQHLPRHRGFDEHLRWCPTYSHDLAMQVVALPLVYGVFALDNVMQMLLLVTGEAWSETNHPTDGRPAMESWNHTVFSLKQTYDTNLDLADLYEAWALRSFGLLCFLLVSRQVQLEVPTVKYLIETVREHLTTVGGADSQDLRILNDLTILNNPKKLLFEPLQSTSSLGVMVFVYTYALKSGYLLSLEFLNYYPLEIQLCGDNGIFQAACSAIPYVDGACFLASTLAILNIVVFEHSLKDILDKERFRPIAKFLAVKIMVSIVFIQYYGLSVIMSSFWRLSDVQIRLSYACLICCEVLPLSILVFVAWRPTEGDWYGGDCFVEGISGHAGAPRRGQLADERSSFSEADAPEFVASRQPSLAMAAGRAMSDELTAIIELRGDVKAEEGKALESIINTLSKTVSATYKPAALYRGLGQRRAYWASSESSLQASCASVAPADSSSGWQNSSTTAKSSSYPSRARTTSREFPASTRTLPFTACASD